MSDNNVQASIAHLVLAGTSVWSLSATPRNEFSYFGTFGNLLFHGGIGFFHFQNPKGNTDTCPAPKASVVESCCGLLSADLRMIYCASCQASRLIVLPCVVAHLYVQAGYRKDLAYMHCLSGLIPFVIYMLGRNHEPIGNMCVIANVMSLFYISLDKKNTWGFILTGASVFSFLFVNASTVSFEMTYNTLYPFSLCFFQYCTLRALGMP